MQRSEFSLFSLFECISVRRAQLSFSVFALSHRLAPVPLHPQPSDSNPPQYLNLYFSKLTFVFLKTYICISQKLHFYFSKLVYSLSHLHFPRDWLLQSTCPFTPAATHRFQIQPQNLYLYLSKLIFVFLKTYICISLNLYLYFSKHTFVFLKTYICISQNLHLYFSPTNCKYGCQRLELLNFYDF